MSLIKQNKIQIPAEDPKIKAVQIRVGISSLSQNIIIQWNAIWDHLWKSENPSGVLKELGKDAKEIFRLNDLMVGFLTEAMKDEDPETLKAISTKLGSKPKTVTQKDGSVVLAKKSAEKQ